MGDVEGVAVPRRLLGRPRRGFGSRLSIFGWGAVLVLGLSALASPLALTELARLGASPASASGHEPFTERVSVADDESQANGGSHGVDMSGDGRYVVFGSSASNLVLGGSGTFDVYVRDRQLGTTELISKSTSGVTGNSTSGWPSISRDGRYVAFMSIASTLTSDDDNGDADVFLHDRSTATTTLISREIDASPGAGRSERPEISADGMHIAFVSSAPDLVAGVTGNHTYVYHVATGVIELVSQSSGSDRGNGSSTQDFPSISDDGRHIVFRSTSTNLDPDFVVANSAGIFVRDVVGGFTHQVRAGFSYRDPAISGNAIWVSYDLSGTGFVTSRANPDPSAPSAFVGSGFPIAKSRWSSDGRFLAFFEQEGPFSFDPYRPKVYDRVLGSVAEVGLTDDDMPIDAGGAAPDTFGPPAISDNGRLIGFWAEGTNIVLGDTNGIEDVFIRDVGDILGPAVTGLAADPPSIDASEAVTITGTVSDVGRGDAAIAGAEINVGTGWQALAADDGSFDSSTESVTQVLGGFTTGIQEACVRSTDTRGNLGFTSCTNFEVTARDIPMVVTVTSVSVQSGVLDNLSQPDFYSRVAVAPILIEQPLPDNRVETINNDRAITPIWTYPGTASSEFDTALVIVEIWDDDTFLNLADDQVDINPDSSSDRLLLRVDLTTGEWVDAPGQRQICRTGDDPSRAVEVCVAVLVGSSDDDFDDDGFIDIWELDGIEIDGDAALEFDLPALGADPCRPTIASEVDFMDGSITGFSHEPLPASVNAVVAAFSAAPIPSPDGCPHSGFPEASSGVDMVIDVDDSIPEEDGNYGLPRFKNRRTDNFNERLLPFVHYGLFIHAQSDGGTTSGVCCRQGGFLVSIGNWSAADVVTGGPDVPINDPNASPVRRTRVEAGTFMHELGHALGLPHGGSDRTNDKPNYLSVMNYRFQTSWLTDPSSPSSPILDYSREALPSLDERALPEFLTLSTQSLQTAYRDGTRTLQSAPVNSPIDWDGDGTIEAQLQSVDINGDEYCVNDGDDNVLDTTPAFEDTVEVDGAGNLVIVSGFDGRCDSVAEGDDVQVNPVGTTSEEELDGFDDWASIDFLARESVYGAGAPDHDPGEDLREITFEEAEQIDAFWSDVRNGLANGAPEISVGTDPLVLEGNTSGGWSGDLESVAAVSATDPDGDPVSLSNDAPPLLPLGDTTVTWTADDGKTATRAEQTVTVVDTTPPSIDPVADITDTTDDPAGTVVNYPNPDVMDLIDPTPTVVCDPASGGTFPVGTTTVTCTTTDHSGNTASTTLDVEIILETTGPLCTIEGTNGSDLLVGTAGPDVICGYGGHDIIFGLGGDDVILPGNGPDIAFGGRGNDHIEGGDGRDVLLGGRGNDHIEGGDGRDVLLGGRGNDVLIGGPEIDRLIGGPGDDALTQ